ncbi:MAG: ABC transporter ATP-binding protein [Rhodospirillales bacterium]|jgi:iron complex transport system ATP-binding protein
MSTLAVQDLSVVFGNNKVLDSLNVSFTTGSLVGLIGPNGAGKTTLLRTLIGAQKPSDGKIIWNDVDLKDQDRRSMAQELAYLPQGGVCHWPLTVERLVALGRLPHQSPWQKQSVDDSEVICAAMKEADIFTLASRNVMTLSGGERMRALLARALSTKPEMLLADEPVASLDPYHQLQVMTLLQAMARRGAGVVVVLHDLTLAARFCDRLVLMNKGQVLGDGEPDDVLSEKNLAASYHVTALRGKNNGEPFIVPWKDLKHDHERERP